MQSRRCLLVVFLLVSFAPPVASQGQGEDRPLQLQPLPVTQLDLRQRDPELDGDRISLGFSQPTPIQDILLLLVRDTHLSLVPDPALAQTFLGDLKNVTIREALDLMLGPLGLDYAVDGQVIRVFPRALETRLYSVDYVSTERADRLYTELAQGVRTLLSTEGRMSLDRTAALLQVTDTPTGHARVSQYLEMVMLRASRQVRIEAQIIEVDLADASSPGVDWQAVRRLVGGAASQEPSGSSLEAAGAALTLESGSQDLLLTALAAQGQVRVLSAPRITAMNNEPVTIRSGLEPFPAVASTSGALSRLVEGVSLSLTSQISADGIVHMSISPSVTSREGAGAPGGAVEGGLVEVREAETVVRVRQGDTVVIAGLLRDRTSLRRSKVPVVGHVPLLGLLFTRTETDTRTTDLVIALTPTVTSLGRPLALADPVSTPTAVADGPLAALTAR